MASIAGVLQTDEMADPHYAPEQRLAFGRVAELYDRARPSYPPAAVDAMIEFAAFTPPTRILEVGAGTGKATVLLNGQNVGTYSLSSSTPFTLETTSPLTLGAGSYSLVFEGTAAGDHKATPAIYW